MKRHDGEGFSLIDRDGRIRAYYGGREFDAKRIVADIHALLR